MKKAVVVLLNLLLACCIAGCVNRTVSTRETALMSETEKAVEAESVSGTHMTDKTELTSEAESVGDVEQADETELTNETNMTSETELTGELQSMNETELQGEAVEYVPYTIMEPEFIKDGICDIPETFERDGVSYRVEGIGANAYENNPDITSLHIPDSVTEVNDSAFARCVNLRSIELGSGIDWFGYFVFAECTSIKEVMIPDNITKIYGCFSGCTGLTDVYLPRAINLSTIDFNVCTSLDTVHYRGTESEWEALRVSAPAPIMETTIDRAFDETVNVIFEQ